MTLEVISFLMLMVVISALKSLPEYPKGIEFSSKSQLTVIPMEEEGLTVK